ncbi:hypothetical protein DL98DRAFT_591249 [Cadophora sp. DSE1049]|nr:hypothetical protein DL98DRAFT_591249 [Cadophora sp. DSE1049]
MFVKVLTYISNFLSQLGGDCDETKPQCSACRRLGDRCEWPSTRLKFCTDILSQNADQTTTVRVISSEETELESNPTSLSTPMDTEHTDAILLSPGVEFSENILSEPNEMNLPWNLQLRDEYTRLSSVPIPLMGNDDIWDDLWCINSSFDDISRVPAGMSTYSGQIPAAESGAFENSSIPGEPPSTPSSPISYLLSPSYLPAMADIPSGVLTTQDASLNSSTETVHVSELDLDSNYTQETAKAIRDDIDDTQKALYLRHWYSNVRHLLPSIFHDMVSRPNQRPCFKTALVALSACNFAQCHPVVQRLAIPDQDQVDNPTGENHRQHGRILYSAAIREFSRIQFFNENALDTLATLILFAYIELDIGSFRGLDFHLNGAERLLADECAGCLETRSGRQLVSAWLGVRIRSWRHKIPFTTAGHQKYLVAMGIDFKQIFEENSARGDAVMSILVESIRLSDMMLFERLAGRGDLDTVSSRCMRDYLQKINRPSSNEPWRAKDPVQDQDYTALLLKQEADLDAWHSTLPVSDLPVESFDRSRVLGDNIFEGDNSSQPPLRFRTHHCAMNYAYYVCARIAQSMELLAQFRSRSVSFPDPKANKLYPWLLILLRIVSGLDIMDCVRYNIYTIGITDLLFSCCLRFPGSYPVIRKCLDGLVERLNDIGMSREGVNTVHFLDVPLTYLEHEREHGRDVFFIITGKTADSEFNHPSKNRKDDPCVVYGKDHIGQKMYSRRLDKIPTVS